MIKKEKIKISFNPNLSMLNEIEAWLLEEEKTPLKGFYCNWDIIADSFQKNQLVTISVDSNVVGFIVWWSTANYITTIGIAEIIPTHRNQGYFKLLAGALFEKFIEEKIYIIDLECAPESSKPTWVKLGFINFPENPFKMYKILVPHLGTTNAESEGEYIEVWNCEPYESESKKPKWAWKIKYNRSGILEIPIIHLANYDWQVRWRINSKIMVENKIKYFGESIVFGRFIVITKIPLSKLKKRN